jgi:hypothetical protein
MTKIESQLEGMSSPIRPYLVRREDKVGCPVCNHRPGECERHNSGVHNTYVPLRVQVKFALGFLGIVAVTSFIILCAAKAVR